MATPGQRGYKGPVHEAVRSALGVFGKGGGGSKPAAPSKAKPKPAKTLDDMRQAAKARMAVSRSYHARSGTTYDPTTGSVSASGKTIGAKNTGRMHSTARPVAKSKVVKGRRRK
jgi:hypothetical protein